MILAVYQAPADIGTPEARIEALRQALRQKTPDLVLCPELFSTGYDPEADYQSLAQTPDGPFARAVARLATETDTAIAYGYPEHNVDGVYNAAALIGSNGQLIANHRKRLQAPQSFEERAFLNGDTVTFADLGSIRIAMVICYEVEFPESIRQAAIGGAQLVLVPTALGAAWGVVAERVVPTRAFENGIWLAYADHAGQLGKASFYGGSRIAAPDGTLTCAPIGTSALIEAEIDLDLLSKARARIPYLRDRAKL